MLSLTIIVTIIVDSLHDTTKTHRNELVPFRKNRTEF